MKAIKLGKCEIVFHHDFEPRDIYNSRTGQHVTRLIPVSTSATVKTATEIFTGHATCSVNDNFSYEEGRKLSMRRAFKRMSSLTKKDRKVIWNEYNKLKPNGRW